jgi:hypothetical protein
MDLIAADWNAVKMPLSINYRCSKAVVRNAQIMVPEIEAWDQAPEGSVDRLGRGEAARSRESVLGRYWPRSLPSRCVHR